MSKSKIVLFIFLLYTFGLYAQRSPDLLSRNCFKAGEYARYKVIYKFSEAWVTAGHVTFDIEERMVDTVKHFAAYVKGNSLPAFDLFYKVRDEYASVFDTKTLLPKFFLRRVSEGGFKIRNDFDFHQDSSYVIADVEDSKSSKSVKSYSIAPKTLDVISAIYYCRSLNFNKIDSGSIFNFPFFIDNENYKVGIKYHGKKTISTEYGEFKCLVLQPTLLQGRIFDQTDQMRIYVTDDDQRIPVYIESPLKIGKIVAVLIKYKKGI